MHSMFPFPISNVSHVYLYPKPISMRFGENKLIDLCKNKIGLDPNKELLFLFFRRHKIKLSYFI